MERDFELIRLILKSVEECQEPNGLLEPPKIDGYEDGVTAGHIRLLVESTFITAENSGADGRGWTAYQGMRLTWIGHDFLDSTRDEAAWNSVKEKVLTSGSSFTYDVIQKILEQVAMKKAIPAVMNAANRL